MAKLKSGSTIGGYVIHHQGNISDTLDPYYFRRNQDTLPTADNAYDIGDSSHRLKNIYSVTFTGTATAAKAADLAEKYTFNKNISEKIEFGNVVNISLTDEYNCEISDEINCKRVIGVISKHPAYLMNSEEDGYPVALKGKVKCKVKGPIQPGDELISFRNGCGISVENKIVQDFNFDRYHVFGKSLNFIKDNKIELIDIIVL